MHHRCEEVSHCYSYGPANQLDVARTSTDRTTYLYDANGNQQIEIAPAGRTTNTWDYENKQIQIALPTGGRVTSTYTPDGLRVTQED